MINRFLVSALLLLLAGPGVAETSAAQTFGETVPPVEEPFSVIQAIEAVEQLEGESIVVDGRITRVCQKRGCWAVFAEGDQTIRVMAVDHSFELPADASGPARAHGRLERRELSEEHVEHLIEDDGADPGLRDDPAEYRLRATGVEIHGS